MTSQLHRHPRNTDTQPVTITLPKDVLDRVDVLADLDQSKRSLTISTLLEKQLTQEGL